MTLVLKVSTKKLIRARASAPVRELECQFLVLCG